jgi:hypothetical protein
MYGNMSSVEKAMNRNDLNAYKNYDNRDYALVPGIAHNKQNSLMNAGNNSLSPKKNVVSEQRYVDKYNHLTNMGYNEVGVSKRMNTYAGRNYFGAAGSVDQGAGHSKDLYSGPANIAIGEA